MNLSQKNIFIANLLIRLKKSCWSYNSLGVMRVSKKKEKEWNHRINILLDQIKYWMDNDCLRIVTIVELFY